MSRDIMRIDNSINQLQSSYASLNEECKNMIAEVKMDLEKAKETIVEASLEAMKPNIQSMLDDFKKQTIIEVSASIRSEIDAKLEVLKTTILQSIHTK